MSATCRDCGVGHEHCHGTVIIHIGQRPECTEDDCSTPEAGHSYVIDCYAVGCGCDPSRQDQPIGPAASRFSSVSEAG